ncbi:ABC transporter substrate-binding protein [Desulforhopalus vacuolatus]|uniref:ABC transporter substrate-binding protein n=1 Tax=Desulforhopalus vacuolatus TaxID=40414 RepID=UPI0019625EAC|nr:ABC transporter substrate-binding protein [Desulforhopalus vacuolatus]MBM9520750.1 ABC transporter substrate-binding protein [Desulforhopalus vacuolatus]
MKKALLMLGLILLLVSCNREAPQQEILTYDQALINARGTRVNFYMWSGSATINTWIDEYVAREVKEQFDIDLNRVPMDAEVFVNKLLTEKQVGKNKGTIDLVWINGENFKNARQAGLLRGPIADSLPNFKAYIDPKSVEFDFGFPVENYEVPYGKAQFVFIFDSAKTAKTFDSPASLEEWVIQHPGKFTYAQPPDFTGSAFLRQIFYGLTGGYEQYMHGFDEQLYLEKSPLLWSYLNRLKPYLWQQGKSYPRDSTALELLFQRGEVDINMSYYQAFAANKIMEGKYPSSVRTFVMDHNSIYNNHFTAIPFNAPNLSGAMVVSNFLLSPEAQLSKNTPLNWGDFTVLDMEKLPVATRQDFEKLDLGEATLDIDVLNRNAVPEIPSDYLTRLENDWRRFVLEK